MGQTPRGKVPQNRRKTGVPNSEATQWKPGQSGNPSGRPKTALLSQACRELLVQPLPNDPSRTYAQAIAQKLADRALKGDIRAAQEIADRAEGKARQSIQFENPALREAFDRMSHDELEAYAVSGVVPGWFPRLERADNEQVQ